MSSIYQGYSAQLGRNSLKCQRAFHLLFAPGAFFRASQQRKLA